ncbi:MAG: elongation factor Ts [Bacteroidetes bacterium]|nr:elongation factor Ts [Bacteroidota bacterium]
MGITAAEVNKLRMQTGAGMMDCKNALVEADGDFEKAIDLLRKKGQKVSEMRAGKDANEGIIVAKVSENKKMGIIIKINCETDFVAENEEFKQFVESIAVTALENKPATIEELQNLTLSTNSHTVSEEISNQVGRIGEKIELSEYGFVDSEAVIAYNHAGNRIGVLVGLNAEVSGESETVAKDVAMQIAAMKPMAIDKDGIDQAVIDREMQVAKEQAREQGKPEEIIEKIAIGKLNKFYSERTLLNQVYVKDSSKSIRNILEEVDKDLTVTSFKRVSL